MRQRMTHREFLIRVAWLELEWNRPSRSDWYLMRIVQCVCSLPAWVWGKSARSAGSLDDQKIPFVFKQETPEGKEKISPEEQAQRVKESKARWGILLAGRGKRGNSPRN
jgi:hypothetical protein